MHARNETREIFSKRTLTTRTTMPRKRNIKTPSVRNTFVGLEDDEYDEAACDSLLRARTSLATERLSALRASSSVRDGEVDRLKSLCSPRRRASPKKGRSPDKRGSILQQRIDAIHAITGKPSPRKVEQLKARVGLRSKHVDDRRRRSRRTSRSR